MLFRNLTPRHAEPGASGGAVPGLPPGVEADPIASAPQQPPDPTTTVAAPDVTTALPDAPAPDTSVPPGVASPDATVAEASALPTDHPWIGQLSEALQSSDSLKKFNSIDDLAQSYINLETMNGRSLRIPGPDASEGDRKSFTEKLIKEVPELMYKPDVANDPEAKEAYLATLGRPQKPDLYTDPEIEGVTPGENDDSGDFKELAFELGLTNDQYKGLVEAVLENNLTAQYEVEAEFGKDVQALRNEWGYAYGDRYRAAADIAVKTGAPDEVVDLFKQGNVHPNTIRWMFSLAKQFGGEGAEIIGQQGGSNIDNAPAEAQARISEIMGNKSHAYWDSGHPDNAKAIQEMVRLQKIANPQASSSVDDLRKRTLPAFDMS